MVVLSKKQQLINAEWVTKTGAHLTKIGKLLESYRVFLCSPLSPGQVPDFVQEELKEEIVGAIRENQQYKTRGAIRFWQIDYKTALDSCDNSIVALEMGDVDKAREYLNKCGEALDRLVRRTNDFEKRQVKARVSR